MPSESNRDDLARIIFTAKPEARYQTWEHTSDGIRAWCRAKADDAMAAGWRKVGVDQVMVSRKDAVVVAHEPRYSAEFDGARSYLRAALADPAGAKP
jgi:hypothetical protein